MLKLILHISSSLLFILIIVSCKGNNENKTIQDAAKFHKQALTIDTHLDTPILLRRDESFLLSELHKPDRAGGKLDFPRMKIGGLDAVFFIVWTAQGDRTIEGNKKVREEALEIFDVIHNNIKKYPDLAEMAYSSEDIYRIVNQGKHAILIGMENGYPIGRDINLLKEYYKLGTRYVTLAHMDNNDICDSSTDEPEHDGLSEFGVEVVKEMNNLGIMVDVSHISDKSFYDVIKISRAPVIASHSSVRSLCDHPRNMSDDMIKTLADNGGVIQITLVDEYIKTPEPNPGRDSARAVLKEKYKNYGELSKDQRNELHVDIAKLQKEFPKKLATLNDAVDHIDYVVNLVGIDHVGIGSDFDGGGGLDGVFDVSEMGNITLELVKRGYTEEDIEKIWGGNLLRVFKEVERIAVK